MAQSSTMETSSPGASSADIARVAGRGAVYITLAKLWFMVSGYCIHFTLPRMLSPEQYGLYQVVVGAISIVNAVIVTSTYQTVSRYVASEPEKADSIKSKGLKLQAAVGGAIAFGFFLLAPVIAANLNDGRLTDYLRLASLIAVSYSFYSVFTGYFNGLKKFLTQAALDATYSTLKLALVVLFVWLGYGVAGGIAGFAISAGLILVLSAVVAGKGNPTGGVRASELLKFQIYLLAFTFVLNLLQKIDLLLIKALSSTDAQIASDNAGYYGAAVNVANISYQAIVSVTFVIFPLVSQVTFVSDRRSTQAYISNALRYTLMIMALSACLFSANAREVLQLVYPVHPYDYRVAAGALSVLAFGMLFFGLLYVITTIISASGRPTASLAIAGITLATSAALNAALIPTRGLTGAAIGTTAGMILGTIAGGAYLLVKFGAVISPLSLARIASCAAIVYAGSLLFVSESKLLILVQLAVLSLLYLAALVGTRELGRNDLGMLKRVLKR